MTSTFTDREKGKAASSREKGGCLSLLFYPPIAFLLIATFFLLASGKTTLASNANEKMISYAMVDVEQKSQEKNNTNGKKQGKIAPLFTPEVHYWDKSIVKWAGKYDLDPNLVATVMQIESCGDPQAMSYAGAIGLFQVMPFHFYEGESPFSPATNANRGLMYLRQGIDQLGSVRLALAGYNGGINIAGQGEENWSDETKRYVYWGLNIYKDAKNDRKHSEVLDEWLASGGASLCIQAQQTLVINP